MMSMYVEAAPRQKRERLIRGAPLKTKINILEDFVETGVIKNRPLKEAIQISGWTLEEVRAAIQRIYKVDKDSIERILRPSFGFTPYMISKGNYELESPAARDFKKDLIKAISDDSLDGKISSIGIISRLKKIPKDFNKCINSEDEKSFCDGGICLSEEKCKTILSWYIFLPACLQSTQFQDGNRSKAYRLNCVSLFREKSIPE